jgi:cytochrome c oxidase subunit 2
MRGVRSAARLAWAIVLSSLGAACHGRQNALDPAGPLARMVGREFWIMVAIAALVWAAVVVAMLYASFHRRRVPAVGRDGVQGGAADLYVEDPALEPERQRRMTSSVTVATAATVAILLVFLIYDFAVGRASATPPASKMLTIQVIGHQWWWEIHYVDSIASQRVTTANEIHVPVGRPVLLEMSSQDVIHSFWVPNLRGKKDLIPGHLTRTWFQADTAGI